MIVNYAPEGWEIITQRAHGCLAAQIASHWKHNIRTERWIETLLAIAEHDDAQIELEQSCLLTEQGGPLDFKMRIIDYNYCIKVLDFSKSKSRYHALLCSMHLEFLVKDIGDKSIDEIITEQKAHRKHIRKQLNLTIDEARRDYNLLEWCDALSLLLCQRDYQPESRTVEISSGPDNNKYELKQLSEGELTVNPWPFAEDNIKLFYETRLLKKLSFKDDDEFKANLSEADVVEKTRILVKR